MDKKAQEILEAKAHKFYHSFESGSHLRSRSIFMIGAEAGFNLGQQTSVKPEHKAEVVKCGRWSNTNNHDTNQTVI